MESVQHVFSWKHQCGVYRQLMFRLAESQKQAGYEGITHRAIESMRFSLIPDMLQIVLLRGKYPYAYQTRDISAHIDGYKRASPSARPIISLGVDDDFISVNTAIILTRDAVDVLSPRLAFVLRSVQEFALKHKSQPCLSYGDSLLDIAKVVTVGSKATGWAESLIMALRNLEELRRTLGLWSAQGMNQPKAGDGTKYLTLRKMFKGDQEKCQKVDDLLREKLRYRFCDSSENYPRHVAELIQTALNPLTRAVGKIAQDLVFFHESRQVMEKEVVQSPKTTGPQQGRSGNFALAALALRQKLDYLMNIGLSKGLADGLLHGIFRDAEEIMNTLQEVIQGLFVSSDECQISLNDEIPFMITGQIIETLQEKDVNRKDTLIELTRLGFASAIRVREQDMPNSFVADLRASKFFGPFQEEINDIISHVINTDLSVRAVERYCGAKGDVELKLYAYRRFFEQKGIMLGGYKTWSSFASGATQIEDKGKGKQKET